MDEWIATEKEETEMDREIINNAIDWLQEEANFDQREREQS